MRNRYERCYGNKINGHAGELRIVNIAEPILDALSFDTRSAVLFATTSTLLINRTSIIKGKSGWYGGGVMFVS